MLSSSFRIARVHDFLANVNFTLPDSQRPLCQVSTLPLDVEDDQAVESQNSEPLLSFEPDYCSSGESMHVDDPENEAEIVIREEGEGPRNNESVEAYTVVISTKEGKAEVVKCRNDWHIDAFLEAVGTAARDSFQQVKVELVKVELVKGEKQQPFDAYLEVVSAAAEAECKVTEVYYCPTPPLPAPFLNASPRVHALTDYPSTPAPGHPGPFTLGQRVYFASTGRRSISALGFPVQAARTALQVPQAVSPSPSLLASEQSNGYTSFDCCDDVSFEYYDSVSFKSYDSASFESYVSGCTTGYAADASDDESELSSSSCFSSSRSSSSGVSTSSSLPYAPPADGSHGNRMVPTWHDIAMRPTFLPHVMPSVPTSREPSPNRSGRRIGVDTYPSSNGLAVRAEQPAYVHPSLGSTVRTVYEICNGKPDKRTWKKPKTSSERKRKRRFLNRFTRMFNGYQNADPIDGQPSCDRGRGNKIPCLDGWVTPKSTESPKSPDTPRPFVGAVCQGTSSSRMATTTTASPSSKKSSNSGFSLFGLFKKKNNDRKKEKGRGKSTDSSPEFSSSRLWSSSSSRPAVRSFERPTLCRPILSLPIVKQEAPLTAMEINALLSAMAPAKTLPPVQHYNSSAHITPATPQRIFSSVPIIMAPTPRIHALGSTPTGQQSILKVPYNNMVSHAGTNPVVMPTTPILKPTAPPVQDVPILVLEPFGPRFVSIEQLLDLALACNSEEEEKKEKEGDKVQSNGGAQVVRMKIYYDADEDDDDDEDDDPDYWYNAYAENPNPIPIIKNKSLERSLRSYHPGNRNSRLEPSTLPACLMADNYTNDGRSVFEDSAVPKSTPSKGKAVYRGVSRSETWRSFSPGKPPLNTIQEATTDAEADDEFSTLASTEYGGSSSSSDDPDAIDSVDKSLLEQVIRIYGQVVVNAALVAAHATGTKFDIDELIDVLEQSFDPDMFKKGHRNREYQTRRERFEEEEIRR
ncbi:hypothetical protein BGZ92_000492 [Podila epicladia]|nr:hypothetical protein BGZ92_000492 [Podila epicladia]